MTLTTPPVVFAPITIIALFAALSTWLMMVGYGPSAAVTVAKANPGNMWLDLSSQVLGHWSAQVMNVLMVTSLFAALLSLTNILGRYIFALGREGVISRRFAALHPREQTPHIACMSQTVVMMVVIVLAGMSGIDPLRTLMPLSSALCSISIISVQMFTSAAIIGFFRRDPQGTNLWQRSIAPALSFVTMAAILFTTLKNIDLLTGGRAFFDVFLPFVGIAFGLGGWGYATWLKRCRQDLYQSVIRSADESAGSYAGPTHPPADRVGNAGFSGTL